MLDTRQELILRLIIEDYIKTAEPVGSKYLCDTYGLGVSSATIRSEMSLLEQREFIRQPHTSAGRIPTEQGYQYYLQNIVQKEPRTVDGSPLHSHYGEHSVLLRSTFTDSEKVEETLKTLAQNLVNVTGETAVVAFEPWWSYYVGVANLFQKPDFNDVTLIRSLAVIFDSFEERLCTLMQMLPNRPVVLIGSQSPFGENVSSIFLRYSFPSDEKCMIGIVGPLRMNYVENLALMQSAYELLEEVYE